MRSAFFIATALLLTSGLVAAEPAPRSPAPDRVVRHASELPAYPIAAGLGTATLLFDASNGSPDTAMTLLVLKPGAAVPPHVHEASAELLYVIEGQATMVVAGQTMTVRAGDAVRIPKGVPHEARVVGDGAFRAVQLYAPAGPEQRFVPAAPR